MKKKNGFIATSVMLSFFLVFILLTSLVLLSYSHYRFLESNLNGSILKNLNKEINNELITLNNIIQNGSFEDSFNYWNNENMKIDNTGFDKNKSVMTGDTNVTPEVYQKINLEKDHYYYVSYVIQRTADVNINQDEGGQGGNFARLCKNENCVSNITEKVSYSISDYEREVGLEEKQLSNKIENRNYYFKGESSEKFYRYSNIVQVDKDMDYFLIFRFGDIEGIRLDAITVIDVTSLINNNIEDYTIVDYLTKQNYSDNYVVDLRYLR